MRMLATTVLLIILTLSLLLPGCAGEEAPPTTPTPTSAPAPTVEPVSPPAPAYDFTALTGFMDNMMETYSLGGASLRIVKDGEIVYEEYFGEYDADTVVGIASASKWFSVAAIMTLVDDGRITLDDPISNYLPEFTGEKGAITIRQCLSHTSGLPKDTPVSVYDDVTSAEGVSQIAQLDLVATPGTVFHYGGVSLQVAGRIAEIQSGQPWVEFFQERLAAPLGMTNTTYGTAQKPYILIGGSALSSLQDYGNFLEMLMNDGVFDGKQVLSAASLEEMRRDQVAYAGITGADELGGSLGYGLGNWLDVSGAAGEAVQFSSPGVYGFTPWLDMERGMECVFLVKGRPRHLPEATREMRQLIRDIIDGKQ
jgi:CubicO group peptidase (beta-lactamase class C family)